MTDEAKTNAEQDTKFVVLGVSRRDLLFILSTTDETEANDTAKAGVLQSKFSDTFVFPVSAHFSESNVRWSNPDGKQIEPATGARLNPDAGEQELPSKTRNESDLDIVSKRDNIDDANSKVDSVDTGKNADGTPTAPKDASSTEAPQITGGAKSGVQSSSDVKGTSTQTTDKK